MISQSKWVLAFGLWKRHKKNGRLPTPHEIDQLLEEYLLLEMTLNNFRALASSEKTKPGTFLRLEEIPIDENEPGSV